MCLLYKEYHKENVETSVPEWQMEYGAYEGGLFWAFNETFGSLCVCMLFGGYRGRRCVLEPIVGTRTVGDCITFDFRSDIWMERQCKGTGTGENAHSVFSVTYCLWGRVSGWFVTLMEEEHVYESL